MKKFSVCMSVYHGDHATFFQQSIDSLLSQTRKPDEIVLVVDGPVGDDINKVISGFEKSCEHFRVVRLEKNSGHAVARQTGVNASKYDYVAIMDSDDIAIPDRFEKQLAYMEYHPECDIVGGQITEFIDSPDNIVGKREVPCDNEAIYQYMRSRCALNQPTVMFKKKSVIDAGNYQDWFWNEDYYMWIRMMERGCIFANLPDVLVNMRSGLDQYGRRGGKKYFDSEIGIKKLMLEKGMITRKEFVINYIQRFIIQLMLPNSVRGWVFRTFARKRA